MRAASHTFGILLLAWSGCGDPPEIVYIPEPRLEQVRIISAYPAQKEDDGSWRRVCGAEPADGIVTNVAYLSSVRADLDKDVSIRPGDFIKRSSRGHLSVSEDNGPDTVDLSSPSVVDFHLDCINPAAAQTNDCAGYNTTASLDSGRYVANARERGTGHNVMLLIDQSGSVGGLVRDVSFKEERIPDPLPQNFGEVASDQRGLRLSAARHLIGLLNAEDRFGALAFGEGVTLSVPCSDGIQDVPSDLDACFGAKNRDTWTASIDSLQASTGGRSNLWMAVKTAYDYLRAKNDTQRTNHIVVLTDGPDTCTGENRLTCSTPCDTADYRVLATELETDADDSNALEIHIHFVQFESLGYPGRDARQVEVACITGGHYQYINSNAFSRAQLAPFQAALDTAVAHVRYSLMGHWELAAAVPDYATNAVPAGALYGLQGALSFKAAMGDLIGVVEQSPLFGFGLGSGAPDAESWDRRPTIRKPCAGFADCGAAGESGSCDVLCSPETLLCANGASPVQLPDLAACDVAGFCCGGRCLSEGACAACSAGR